MSHLWQWTPACRPSLELRSGGCARRGRDTSQPASLLPWLQPSCTTVQGRRRTKPQGNRRHHCQVEAHEQINVPRGLTQPPPGAVQPARVVVCLLLVSAVMVQEVAHDDATVAFFLGHSLAEKQCEEEVELEVQVVTKEQHLVRLVEELLGRGEEARAKLSRLEMGVIGWVMAKWEVREVEGERRGRRSGRESCRSPLPLVPAVPVLCLGVA